jgi:hypothetical protein
MDTLQIVLKTADELVKEGTNWRGDVFDFVSASSSVSDRLSSSDLRELHRHFCGSSFVTDNSEVFFYYSGRTPTFQIYRRQEV